MLESQVGVDAATTARLLGLLVPLLVALIAKKSASSGLKGVLNVLGSALIGSVTYLVAEDGGYDWTGFINGTLDTLIPSVAAYYALWKPTGLAGSVTNATSGFGLGSPPTLQTDDVGAESAGVEETNLSLSEETPSTVATSPKARAKMRKNDTGALDFGLLARILMGVGILVIVLSYVIEEFAYRGLGVTMLVIGLILFVILAVTGRSSRL